MITKNNLVLEFNNNLKRKIIREHLLECYKKIGEKVDIDTVIKQHRKIINDMQLKGKPKNIYKTLDILKQYKKTKNKGTALYVLTNTLNNLNVFS